MGWRFCLRSHLRRDRCNGNSHDVLQEFVNSNMNNMFTTVCQVLEGHQTQFAMSVPHSDLLWQGLPKNSLEFWPQVDMSSSPQKRLDVDSMQHSTSLKMDMAVIHMELIITHIFNIWNIWFLLRPSLLQNPLRSGITKLCAAFHIALFVLLHLCV